MADYGEAKLDGQGFTPDYSALNRELTAEIEAFVVGEIVQPHKFPDHLATVPVKVEEAETPTYDYYHALIGGQECETVEFCVESLRHDITGLRFYKDIQALYWRAKPEIMEWQDFGVEGTKYKAVARFTLGFEL
jgi:hypothetical protein